MSSSTRPGNTTQKPRLGLCSGPAISLFRSWNASEGWVKLGCHLASGASPGGSHPGPTWALGLSSRTGEDSGWEQMSRQEARKRPRPKVETPGQRDQVAELDLLESESARRARGTVPSAGGAWKAQPRPAQCVRPRLTTGKVDTGSGPLGS